MDQSIINRIAKLLALSESPEQAEAEAALLKAQELMYAHGLTASDIRLDEEREEEPVHEEFDYDGKRLPYWVSLLGSIIAKNFRCKAYIGKKLISFNLYRASYENVFTFIGMPSDVDMAKRTFRFGINAANSLFKQYKKENQERFGKSHAESQLIRKSYFMGFVSGLEKKFQEQVQTKALAIRVPNAVMQAYRNMSLRKSHVSSSYNPYDSSYARGYKDGRQSQANSITAG